MKRNIRIISILIMVFMTISCTVSKNVTDIENHEKVQTSNIEGVWKLIYSDLLVDNLPEEIMHYKIIVDGRFFWYQVNNEDGTINSSDGAGGTYSVRDSLYTEHVEHVFPQMITFKGHAFETTFEISGNILKTKGKILRTGRTFEEIFEKVSVSDKNVAELAGTWKLLTGDLISATKKSTGYKLIVDNWFLYYMVDNYGVIKNINGMGGILTKNDSLYVETVTHTLSGDEPYKSTYKYEISKFQNQKDILKVQGINPDGNFTEVFEKVKNNTTNNNNIENIVQRVIVRYK